MSVRAGVIAFVTALATMANAPTALGDLPEHKQVAEFSDSDVDSLPPGEFEDFGFGEAVAIRDDVAFIGVPRARQRPCGSSESDSNRLEAGPEADRAQSLGAE